MKKSESIKELASALKDFQAEVKNPKNVANNPFFNSKYAPLDEVINTVKEPLSKHGLSYIQMPNSEDGALVAITTMLLHESGEWIESEPLKLKSDKPTAQGSGSSITYARRYQLSAMLGIASEDEDDGSTTTAHTISEAKEPERITKEQAEEIRSLSKEKKISEEYICKFRKVNRFEDLQENDWKAAMEWLRKK
ncbi:ERF superfamily protein [Clostridium argentinense CDC 2741]|uniref:ERF superfamily protein n=1 Tax=Clostridium argentinense CDC 2741 TaxID=1418104 RepID=A0A0C1UJQ3_9CLOT|nr:ERF family protein [Clostridium argentinense]KIE47500.1 ERF superfamily protein [Clostridium argentinense CDC 2741]NFF38690.1 ERF family protein [Clostridium argentinense]NFP48915.1 ERF family protein [Clostridium argentinense]NFP72935.1 ERF family protein [Clostridium argentinense]NFP75695.1 ERF family protein [Clostridium argentinense]